MMCSQKLAEPREVSDSRTLKILMAEDNEGDVYLVHEALQSRGLNAEVSVQEDGELMLRQIARIEKGEAPCPDVVLLDLNLPKRNGEVLLARIRQSSMFAEVPVVIVTSSDSARDREATARLGATRYFRKPLNFDEFLRLGDTIKEVLQ